MTYGNNVKTFLKIFLTVKERKYKLDLDNSHTWGTFYLHEILMLFYLGLCFLKPIRNG